MPEPVTPRRAYFRVDALAKNHNRSAFLCGGEREALDRHLQKQAREDAEKLVAASFVLVKPPDNSFLGYYTLSASSVAADELPNELAKKLPRYPRLPVTLLGRLAVDQSRKGQGMGELLLMDALLRSLDAANEIAAMAVVVDVKDAAAAAFYEHFGFIPLQRRPMRLFLPMKTVATLFAS